jgi:hypothetical protein
MINKRFRVWDKEEKKFINSNDFYYWDFCFWYEPYKENTEPIIMNNSRYIIEEYFGLKDKNDTCIYKGDLLKFKGNDRIFEVIWDDANFCYKLGDVKSKDLYSIGFTNRADIEVVGNVHESDINNG